jgi:low temperature requirement protein LtrA
MKGVILPDRQEDFAADPVELFFDLAYVFAFSQLVSRLVQDPSWVGVGKASLLFVMMWLGWQQFTWSANAVSGNGRPVRVLFLIATAISVPMAASVSTAFGRGGVVFASGVALILLAGLATSSLAISGDKGFKSAFLLWALATLASIVLIFAGAVTEGRIRIGLWVAASVVMLAAMTMAGNGKWIIRSGHFAERHALIIIVALGEVIVAVGSPVVHALEVESSVGSIVFSLGASAVFMALLWWSYFDRPGPAIEYRAEQIEDPAELGSFVRDVYTWGHALIAAGVIAAAAALEEIVLHPSEHVEAGLRIMLFGGLGLTLLGVAFSIWRSFKVVPPERMIMLGLVGVLLFLGDEISGVWLLVGVDLIFFATLIFEERRVAELQRQRASAEA